LVFHYFFLEKKMIKSISIVFPIFNEEKRIFISLIKIKKFILKSRLNYLQIIFVDDGSTDRTKKIIKDFIKKYQKKAKIIYIKNFYNRGKGYSLKKGVKLSNGEWILTTDIDLSVDLGHFFKWNELIKKKKYEIFFGSRNLPNSNVKKKIARFILGNIFKFLVYILFHFKLNDTQCGYKLYKKKIAKKIFYKLKTYRYSHDIEIILLAIKMKITIKEMPVKWIHKSHSKMNLVNIIRMLFDLILIRIKYLNT